VEFINSTKLGNQYGFILQNPPTRCLENNDSFDNSTGLLLKRFGFNLALKILLNPNRFSNNPVELKESLFSKFAVNSIDY
jgi:hypothetical protein